MNEPVQGQRWISRTEPEAGLGVLRTVLRGRLEIEFPAISETRIYAWPGAPIERHAAAIGTKISWGETESRVVTRELRNGLIWYGTEQENDVCETHLVAATMAQGPWERLGKGTADPNVDFAMRRECLFRRAKIQRSKARGFTGVRMELIRHQLAVAASVSLRRLPRALLADEVGLGKTIEAGLILHRLHLTGRVSRILILVPEPLIHQWFVELLRRFNLLFRIFDPARFAALLTAPHGEGNPFLDEQLILCPWSLMEVEETAYDFLLQGQWDLVIVDEVHRIQPEAGPQEQSKYGLLEQLSARTPGLLLLSGTPDQTGPAGHFARLRLLDPHRFKDLETFLSEIQACREAIDGVGKDPAPGESSRGAEATRLLLERRGPGRVLFRNTRGNLGGFPGRNLTPHPLERGDPETRAAWLADFLRKLPARRKVLLITRAVSGAESLKEGLLQKMDVKVGLFHDNMALLQRDRQAAWFSEEDGARLLICSEIGSEGRNFQFASDLILWDLPENPDLLEQRIGRLDRIGQAGVVQIHVPYAAHGPEEVLLHWYAEGLQIFKGPVSGANRIALETHSILQDAMANPLPATSAHLAELTRRCRTRVQQELAEGYEMLLCRQSAGDDTTDRLVQEIRAADGDRSQQVFWIRLLDFLGMQRLALGPASWHFQPASSRSESLPGISPDGLSGTFERKEALAREDLQFFSNDHPLLLGALDQLLRSGQGCVSCAWLEVPGPPDWTLEVCYSLECPAPRSLAVERFLPSVPVRVVVDSAGTDRSGDEALQNCQARDADTVSYHKAAAVVLKSNALEIVAGIATHHKERAIHLAMRRVHREIDFECGRLIELGYRPGTFEEREYQALVEMKRQFEEVLPQSSLRLDCLRIGLIGPPGKMAPIPAT